MDGATSSFYTSVNTKKSTNYFLLFVLIATTANPFFFDSNEFLITGFLISCVVFLIRGKSVDANYFKVTVVFLILEFLQYMNYGVFVLDTFLSLFIKLTFAYFTVRCLEGRFFSYFVQFMRIVCVISLVFYAISFVPVLYLYIYNNITPFFEPPFYKSADFFVPQKNVILYTFAYDCFLAHRNPGPFWEPGIYSIFLILALIVNISITHTIKNSINFLFIFTILTTISTAGYLGLFLLLFFYLLSNRKIRFKFIYIFLIVSLAIYLFYALPFLSEKLSQNAEMLDFTGSRFGSLAADWALFIKSPWIGWGRGAMRFGGVSSAIFTQDFHRNNGLASLITQYGIFLTIFYFYFYYCTFRAMCFVNRYFSVFAFFSLIVILFVSFSQVIYMRQFFLSLLFLGLHLQKLNPDFKLKASAK